MADDAALHLNRHYPTDHEHRMCFNRGMVSFSVAYADNGMIFEEYDVVNDQVRRKVATTPEQLQKIFDDWHKERTGQVLEYAKRFFDGVNNP